MVPGGDPSPLFEDQRIGNLLRALDEKGKTIVAICGGPSLLAAHGLLEGRRCTGDGEGLDEKMDNYHLFSESEIVQEGVVHDGNIITATGGSFTDLCLYMGKLGGLYESEEEYIRDWHWVKGLPKGEKAL